MKGTRKMIGVKVPRPALRDSGFLPPDGSSAHTARGTLLGMRLVGAPAG